MEPPQIDLYEFLVESELQHYYNAIKNELKITSAAQCKYAADEDLRSIGLSRPEIRRLRKFYEKHFPHGYLSKIKRLLQTPTAIVKRDDGGNGSGTLSHSSTHSNDMAASLGTGSPSKTPNNKHIIPADSISVNKQLGVGEFGIVQQGVWTNGTERIQVAIKCLCRERMQSNPMEFLKEAAIMHSIEHENIVRLYGVVLATDSLMLVTELAHLRSLLECLKDSGLRVSFLTVPTLCEFAMQICNGMRYLEQKRLIHRDLAARNILVFSKNKVKISDFGLSRALGVGKDYYKTNFNVNLKLPIAWCAPECINYLRFTNASDVWAFGVCLWEMFSYGFQPWAALTGLQILEAIDAPNYQRLEQPECCPREYYTLMMKCWQEDPLKRPRFSEIYEMLPDMKPEQLKAVVNCAEPKKDHLMYRQGEIFTVLDRNTGNPYWKGVLSTGKTGFFNPSNTVAYIEGLPSANRDSFCRVNERCSKRKLRTEMISKPQNDFKHTGHVGIDGASFGDVAFLSNPQNYNHVPHQIVTPYKPSEDIEQTPLLLPPTPTSPDSLQTASGYFPEGSGAASSATSMNPSFISSAENTPKHFGSKGSQPSFEFPTGYQPKKPPKTSTNPFANEHEVSSTSATQMHYGGMEKKGLAAHSTLLSTEAAAAEIPWRTTTNNGHDEPHEYHEISDDEMAADKLDFGPSLLDEINSMFGSMSTAVSHQPRSPDFEQVNKKNEFTENNSKLSRKLSGNEATNGKSFGHGLTSKKRTPGVVKQISVKDERILNHAIEIANEISARSMNDLVSDAPAPAQSPKRKFSFRFAQLTNNGAGDKTGVGGSASGIPNSLSQFGVGSAAYANKNKNFSEELKNIPDLQALIGEEGREAYNSLIERKTAIGVNLGLSSAVLLRHLDTNEFEKATVKTLPRRSVHLREETQALPLLGTESGRHLNQLTVPLQNAPRPMTLPTRGAASRLKKAELTTGVRRQTNEIDDEDDVPPGKENDAGDQSLSEETAAPLESPSYMVNTGYKFPEQDTPLKDRNPTLKDRNPIPLPPRDGKKNLKTNAKRHVRKYPLIIPANGVQRTLNKVTEMTAADEEDSRIAATTAGGKSSAASGITFEVVASMRPPGVGASKKSRRHDRTPNDVHDESHTYENIERHSQEACLDSASLQFESILEADFNQGSVLQSPDVTDGFYNFAIQKENYNKSKGHGYEAHNITGLYVNEDELRNLDMEKSLRVATTEAAPDEVPEEEAPQQDALKGEPTVAASLAAQDCELAGNALFKKVRESVEMAMSGDGVDAEALPVTAAAAAKDSATRAQTEGEYFAAAAARLANSNSVSCEDLLEFSNKKPKGCERGVDSDEVRIMMKVLGKDSTPPRCLEALEFIEWDVHKAIKVIKLQNILEAAPLGLGEAIKYLQKYEWDLHATALRLRDRAVKT